MGLISQAMDELDDLLSDCTTNTNRFSLQTLKRMIEESMKQTCQQPAAPRKLGPVTRLTNQPSKIEKDTQTVSISNELFKMKETVSNISPAGSQSSSSALPPRTLLGQFNEAANAMVDPLPTESKPKDTVRAKSVTSVQTVSSATSKKSVGFFNTKESTKKKPTHDQSPNYGKDDRHVSYEESASSKQVAKCKVLPTYQKSSSSTGNQAKQTSKKQTLQGPTASTEKVTVAATGTSAKARSTVPASETIIKHVKRERHDTSVRISSPDRAPATKKVSVKRSIIDDSVKKEEAHAAAKSAKRRSNPIQPETLTVTDRRVKHVDNVVADHDDDQIIIVNESPLDTRNIVKISPIRSKKQTGKTGVKKPHRCTKSCKHVRKNTKKNKASTPVSSPTMDSTFATPTMRGLTQKDRPVQETISRATIPDAAGAVDSHFDKSDTLIEDTPDEEAGPSDMYAACPQTQDPAPLYDSAFWDEENAPTSEVSKNIFSYFKLS